MNLQSGDIVAVQANWLERLAGARYGHTGIVWQHNGQWFTIEAGPLGVRAWVYGHWPRPWFVLRPMHATPEQCQRAADAALGYLGQPYGWWAFLAIAWRVLWQRRRVSLARVQRVVCTELVVECYRLQGVDLCPGERADRVTPDMVSVSEELELVAAHEQHRR